MKNNSKKDLTSTASRIDIVVLTTHILGGASHAIDTEDVAIRANELAPGIFAWRKYPEQINLELVRVTLSDAKKQKNGGLLVGSGRTGWRLSAAGVSWAASYGRTLLESNIHWDASRRTAGSVDAVRKERELKRIKGSEAWRRWQEDMSFPVADARWIFRIDSFTSDAQKDRKIVRISSLFADNKAVSEFLSYANSVLSQGTGGRDG